VAVYSDTETNIHYRIWGSHVGNRLWSSTRTMILRNSTFLIQYNGSIF
jgi:hypothetical protein